jgi:hypothetical protein
MFWVFFFFNWWWIKLSSSEGISCFSSPASCLCFSYHIPYMLCLHVSLFIPSYCFFCNLLCPLCRSQAHKGWLNILLPTFKPWSLSSYMDVCFIHVGSSIYYKQSLCWQNHIFRSFHLKNIKEEKVVSQIKQLLYDNVGEDQMYECGGKGSGITVDKMTMSHQCRTLVKKGNMIVGYMSRIINYKNHKALSINQSLQILA